MTDDEMIKMIDGVSSKFVGQLDDLQSAVGMVMMGRLYGWRVIRLVSSNRLWRVACNLFGDLKELLPEEGVLTHKSVGLKIIDGVHDFWGIINGDLSRDALPLHERKKVA